MSESEINIDSIIQEIMAERKQMKALPVLATRYFVVRTPAQITDKNGNYLPPDPHRVSPYFGRKQDALDWITEHSEEGFTYGVSVQYLREFTEQRWSSF